MRSPWPVLLGGTLLSTSCGTPSQTGEGTSTGAETPATGVSTGASALGTTSTEAPSTGGIGSSLTGTDATSSSSGSTSSEGGSFIVPGDLPPVECSLFDQDCNPGQACRAWADDGGPGWSGARCTPIADDPGQAGAPCTVQTSPVSGIDSCDVGLMCWHVDEESLEGECVPYCQGTPIDPTCADDGRACLVFEDGALPLCLPPCDPLATECGESRTCAWAPNDAFACVEQNFVPCPDGTRSYAPDEGPSTCAEGEPCCVPYCDTSGPPTCPAGLLCQPFYLEPNPDHPDLGLCWPFGG